jgi:hypothetical protein
MDRTHSRVYADSLCTEIETSQWILGQSLNVRRRIERNEGRYYY